MRSTLPLLAVSQGNTAVFAGPQLTSPQPTRMGPVELMGAGGIAARERVWALESRPLVTRNAASRQRLAELIAHASGDEVSAQTRSTIATILAHLAFWDRFVYARWRQGAELGLTTPAEIEDAHMELVNEAGFPQWRLISLEHAARDAIEVAEALDVLIEGVDHAVVEQLITAGRLRLVDRSVHRDEHLSDLDDMLLVDQHQSSLGPGSSSTR